MIHKGYLCYDHKLRYVLVSRNVIFLNMFIILLLYQSIPRTSMSILQNFLDPKETANSPTYRSLIVYQHRKNKKDLMITSSPFRWKLSQYPHPSFGYSRQPTTQWYSTCSQVLCVSKILTFFQNLNSFSVVLDTTWIPQMYEQASSIPPLKEAMESEFQALKENGP